MDKNRRFLLTMLLVLSFLMFGWPSFLKFLNATFPSLHLLPSPTVAVTATAPATAPALTYTTGPASTEPGVASTGPSFTSAPALTAGWHVVGGAPAAPLIGLPGKAGAPSDSAMTIGLTSRGAGITSVSLNDFKAEVGSDAPFSFQAPFTVNSQQNGSLQTRSVTINGTTLDLASVDWALDEVAEHSAASFHVDLVDPSNGIVRISKRFDVLPRTAPSLGFEPVVKYSFDNRTGQPVTLQLEFNGPTMPVRESERSDDRQILAGYGSGGKVTIEHQYLAKFTKDNPTLELLKSDKGAFAWAGAGSVYFNAIVRVEPATGAAKIDYDSVTARILNPDEADADKHEIAIAFKTAPFTLGSKDIAGLPMEVFFGPKSRAVLDDKYYSSFPLAYNESLVMVSGPCSFCTFPWMIEFLVRMLGVFHAVFRDWGLAIICLVVIVRVLLHPITKRSQVSMSKMGKMGPEIERLKKKYGDDKEQLNKAMMEVYKEQGFTPILGCLPMLLQTPIWIALYTALQNEFRLRQEPFLWFKGIHLTWIKDLAQPDHLIMLSKSSWFTIPLLHIQVNAINLLPMLLAVVFFLQQKFTPKPVAATPEQAQQQKMMQWMSLLFPLFLYTAPSGLNLYILTSTTIGIIEAKRVRDHIKERDEREKAGRVLVDAKPTRAGKTLSRNKSDAPEPTGFLGNLMANFQKRIAEAQRDAERRKKQE